MLNSMDPHADLNTFPMFYDGQANDPGTMALAAAAFIALGIFLGSSLGVSLGGCRDELWPRSRPRSWAKRG